MGLVQDLLVDLIKDFCSDYLAELLVVIDPFEHLKITINHGLKDSVE